MPIRPNPACPARAGKLLATTVPEVASTTAKEPTSSYRLERRFGVMTHLARRTGLGANCAVCTGPVAGCQATAGGQCPSGGGRKGFGDEDLRARAIYAISYSAKQLA